MIKNASLRKKEENEEKDLEPLYKGYNIGRDATL